MIKKKKKTAAKSEQQQGAPDGKENAFPPEAEQTLTADDEEQALKPGAEEEALPSDKEEKTLPSDEEEQEAGSAPLMVHLMALRRVFVVSFIAIAIAFFLVYYLAIDHLMAWITGPIVERGIDIIYTAMSEALVTKFKVALIAAVIVASPVIIGQIWGFIKPAL